MIKLIILKALIFLALFSVLSSSKFKTENCDQVSLSFKPAGMYFDSEKEIYRKGLEVGERPMKLKILNCKFNSRKKTLKLKGTVIDLGTYTTLTNSDTVFDCLPFIQIFLAKKSESTGLTIIRSIDTTDMQGCFNFHTKLGIDEKVFFKGVGHQLFYLDL